MSFTAPTRLDLGPGAVLQQGTPGVDMTIYCGADWAMAVPFLASDGVTPVSLTSPEMEIRSVAGDPSSTLILTPTLFVSGNVVTVSITGTASLPIQAPVGYYDLFATRADTNARVKLLFGKALFSPATTVVI